MGVELLVVLLCGWCFGLDAFATALTLLGFVRLLVAGGLVDMVLRLCWSC